MLGCNFGATIPQRIPCQLAVHPSTQLRVAARGGCKARGARHVKFGVRSACLPADSDEPDMGGPPGLGDWRDFRNRLIIQQGAQKDGRESEDNMRLLQIQNLKLGTEGTWAHPTATVEQGGVLLATNDLSKVLGQEQLWQAVVLVIEHSDQGSVGLLLNRPTGMLFGRRPGGLQIENALGNLQQVFAENRIYCGGFTAQSVMHVLHGQNLPGSVEVVPGVFVGGEGAAAKAVEEKELTAEDFRFFAGAVVWERGELEASVKAGCWYTAACSRNLVLKQCLQLPVPLWREICLLMGGEHAKAAEDAYEGDE